MPQTLWSARLSGATGFLCNCLILRVSRTWAHANRAITAPGRRLSTELVAGVIVGAGVGWLLDRWLGISPWGFIVFLLLGFAAGMLNVMRTAKIAAEREQSTKR